MEKIEKKAILAIKIALAAVGVSALLGILSLWVLLNQATISVGIDKKLIDLDARLNHLEQKMQAKNNKS